MKKTYIRLTSALMAAALLTGCSNENSVIQFDDIEYKEQMGGTRTVELGEIKDLSAMHIAINSGSIKIVPSDDDNVTVAIDYQIYANDHDLCQEFSDRISSVGEDKDGVYDIKLADKDSGKDIERWICEKGQRCRIELSADVSVPTYFNNFSVDVKTGNITFKDLSGSFIANAETGNITCTGSNMKKSSDLYCEIGNITITSCTFRSDAEIKVKTGNVSFGLPKDNSEGGKVDVSVDTGSVSFKGDTEYSMEKGSPESGSMSLSAMGCEISASVNSGKLKIDKENN
ncbi:hypothetical protein [Ruminococcus flavefaciens]|uniref:Adhesin domain-containing protein n=1 Tax=Ruminococcus flavefaciens 007c TaxID=1341157 RepID=W7UZE3_RUMFL|nr:hypothetical protein [Ruminococcus flavefaciens]EWM53822.1 hypothetical protein RF007C_08910 [Ruminococcus flavefaciens 007c]